jgi:hypothetical protein
MKLFNSPLSREEHDAPSNRILGAALAVHRELGPGLLESAYEACLASSSSFLCV